MNTQNILAAAAGLAVGYFAFREKNSAVGASNRITKSYIKARIYKPTGDFFIEDNGNSWIIHLTPKDAYTNHSNLSALNAMPAGNGYYGAAYSIQKNKKSEAASRVLKLMDQDYSYSDALITVLNERPYLKKKSLEKELDLYI